MKILFTCVGRRVELIQSFKKAAKRLCINLEIYGVDIVETAPALYFCDKKIIVPRIKDKNYIPTLKSICKNEKIDALIPTIDTDLLLLAEQKNNFGNTKVFVSSFEMVSSCRDKRCTTNLFGSAGLKSPKTVENIKEYNQDFPAFIKPRDGSSSIFAYKVNNIDELKSKIKEVPNHIIQKYIEGTEYTVDVLCDLEGNPIFITPRIRMSVRTGEVLTTKIDQDVKIINEVRELINICKPCGPITIQLIREKYTDDDYFIELNPRFGGGAPLSIMAGADSSEMILKVIKGEKIPYFSNAAEHGAIYSRFDQSIRVDKW